MERKPQLQMLGLGVILITTGSYIIFKLLNKSQKEKGPVTKIKNIKAGQVNSIQGRITCKEPNVFEKITWTLFRKTWIDLGWGNNEL